MSQYYHNFSCIISSQHIIKYNTVTALFIIYHINGVLDLCSIIYIYIHLFISRISSVGEYPTDTWVVPTLSYLKLLYSKHGNLYAGQDSINGDRISSTVWLHLSKWRFVMNKAYRNTSLDIFTGLNKLNRGKGLYTCVKLIHIGQGPMSW